MKDINIERNNVLEVSHKSNKVNPERKQTRNRLYDWKKKERSKITIIDPNGKIGQGREKEGRERK